MKTSEKLSCNCCYCSSIWNVSNNLIRNFLTFGIILFVDWNVGILFVEEWLKCMKFGNCYNFAEK